MPAISSKTLSKFRPRMLVVDDEPGMIDLFRDLVAKAVNCQPVFASNLSDAKAVMRSRESTCWWPTSICRMAMELPCWKN